MLTEKPMPTVETDSGQRRPFLSKSTIKAGGWYRLQPRLEDATVLGAAVKTLIGVAIGGLAFAYGSKTLAILIWVVSAVIGAVTLGSHTARSRFGRGFAAFGRAIGWLLGIL